MNNRNTRQDLLALLCAINDPQLMNSALEIILSPSELDGIENRLQIFQLLGKKIPHREIAARLGVGIATVTRGAATVKDPSFAPLAQLISALETAPSVTTRVDKQP